MRRKRQIRSQFKHLEPAKRPNPFQPPKSWYRERPQHFSVEFERESEYKRQTFSANQKYARIDKNIQDMGRHCPHGTITDNAKRVTDSRFETNPASSFLGGEVM